MDTPVKEFHENSIAVYSYLKVEDKEKENYSIYQCHLMHEPRQKYWSDKDLCAPKLYFFDESKHTCREIKIMLFEYVFALIKFPDEIAV